MSDLIDLPGLHALRQRTAGNPRLKVAVLDGAIDLDRACFQGARLTRLDPYWDEEFAIGPEDLRIFRDVRNSDRTSAEKSEYLQTVIPDKKIRTGLYLRFHASHISSVLCGQPDSPVHGVAPGATFVNIPVAYSEENFINPLNLVRAFSAAIECGAHIIHCAACHPTQSGLAHEFLDKVIRQAQQNNILIVAPGGNDKGKCWCIPAVLEGILAVGALSDAGKPMPFSNYGDRYAQQGILAPGENILGAQPGSDEPARESGTSCAAPIVTGVAALLMSLQLDRGAAPDAEAVRAALIRSALPCGPGTEPERCLHGRLNIPGAYELLVGEPLVNPLTLDLGDAIPASTAPKESTTVTAIAVSSTAPTSRSEPQTTSRSARSSRSSANQSSPADITPSDRSSLAIVPSQRSSLVYALGTLGCDFGTEARRDSFKQLMPAATHDGALVPANPYDARQMVDYLEANPWESKSLIWTLNLELTPVYAIVPAGAFAMESYAVLQAMLAGQVLPATDTAYIERVSIPGHLSDRHIRLFSGQIVPILEVKSPRGMYGWQVNVLAAAAVDAALATAPARQENVDSAALRRSLSGFLNRIYYDLRNPGQLARDRALNFAATNAFQAAQTFATAIAAGMELESIAVEKSPFCRLGSDCWDVKLKFFDPDNNRRARKVFRFTIDVQDTIPVTLGEVRSWSVSA